MMRWIFVVAFLAVAQQHGEDAKCTSICTPQDLEWTQPEELPTYKCPGACKTHETDPCDHNEEAKDCGSYCKKACCRCRSAHCP